jgi:hypothetical protein
MYMYVDRRVNKNAFILIHVKATKRLGLSQLFFRKLNCDRSSILIEIQDSVWFNPGLARYSTRRFYKEPS